MAATLPKFEFLSTTFFMLCFLSIACAERDFNFNDSQVSLLEPKDEPNNNFHQDPYAAEVARCHYTKNEIVLSLVLKKHDWSDISDNKKSKVLEKLSKFFAIPKEFIVLESVTKHDLYDMQKQSIRKGNNKCHSNRRLGRVDFMLGCGTKYFSMGEPIANQIGQQMKDGSINNIAGEKFGWWIIWRKDVKTRAERNRRQVEGSGEDDYDNEDDYDYDDDDEHNEPPTEIPATTTHAHRHHHGASKPDLSDTSNELSNNADAVAGNMLNNNENNQHSNNNNQSNKPQITNKLDDEIIESVSQLESVITKTIENTKHIKELPVVVPSTSVVDDDVVAVDEEDDEIAVDVDNENEAVVPAVEHIDGGGALDKNIDMQTNRIIDTADDTLDLSSQKENAIATTSINSISSMTQKISLDSQLEHDSSEASSSVNVAEVIEYSASSATVTVGLDPTTTTATAATTTTTTTTATNTPPFSTLLTNSNNKLSLPPQISPHSPQPHQHNYDTSSISSVVVVNSTLSSLLSSSRLPPPPPSSSPSSALSSLLSTTTTTAMQSKQEPNLPSSYDEIVDSTMWPINSEDDLDNNAGDTEIPIIAYTTTTPASSYTLTTISLSTEQKLMNLTIIEPMSTTTTTTTTATLAITTTTEPTDYISIHKAKKDGENTPPTIPMRLQKFVITSGKEFRFIVPTETFYDAEEDQSNLRLDLTDEVGHVLKPTSWLQFNPESREIYGLPVIDTLYKYKYRLTATDSGNMSVTEIVEIEVTKRRGEPNVNHEINVDVKINDKNVLSVDWQMKLIRAIAKVMGDESTSQLVVREIRQTPYDPTAATLVYFNETLPINVCPETELNSIVQRIDGERLSDLVYPTVVIKSITGKLIGPCQFFYKGTTPKAAESSIETSSILPTGSGTSSTENGDTSPTTSTSTSALPDTTAAGGTYTDYVEPIEPKVENTPPEISKRLDKFALTSGKVFHFIVPAETFDDAEDQSNLRLELTDINGHELAPNSWLHFNAETREIYGLPLDTDTHKYDYLLSATDSGNLTVAESIQINVQQYSRVRSANHQIYVAIKLNDKNVLNLDWQIKLIKAIASTLGDDSTTHLVVREIRLSPYDPTSYTFVYYNETLPITECPDSELNSLVQRIDVQRLSDLVYPTLSIKSITGQLINACKKDLSSTKTKQTSYMTKNEPPKAVNQVDRVNATVNQLLVYKVPADSFADANDNEPKLTLRSKENKELDPRNWLQFDSKNNEFYGIPKSVDVGSEEYLLVAEDSGGLTATDALVVVVSHTPRKDFTAYFKVYLAIRNDQFNTNLQRKFFERLAQLFGDQNTDLIVLRSIVTPHDSDSTIVNFYNTTLQKSNNRCHEEEIEAIRNVYFDGQGYLRDRVKKILGPELNLTQIQIMPTMGSCYPNVNHHDIIPIKTEEPTLKSTFAEDYMFTFILPAVIIIGLIIIAAIVACCLHHRRMSGKMELGDEEERKSFRPKGIPVIFQDELDEKPESGNKSPIILKNEKPPLLSPSYNTSNMNGDNDVDEYVPPPAVVVGGREIRGKSPATPSYRKPPPYVSP